MEPSRPPLLNPPFSPLPGQCQLVYVNALTQMKRERTFQSQKHSESLQTMTDLCNFACSCCALTSPPGFESFITSCNTGSGHWLPQIHY